MVANRITNPLSPSHQRVGDGVMVRSISSISAAPVLMGSSTVGILTRGAPQTVANRRPLGSFGRSFHGDPRPALAIQLVQHEVKTRGIRGGIGGHANASRRES